MCSSYLKNLNVTVFSLISRTNEPKSINWHETSKCVCRLDKIIYNNKEGWNKDKCRCQCKELIDQGVCDQGFIFSRSNCESECDKSCNNSQHLDYSDCKCKKKLIGPLIEECTENDNETKIVNITVKKENSSWKVYIVLITVFLTNFTGIMMYLVYYN